jgi:ATP-dependent DNA helicase RecQ
MSQSATLDQAKQLLKQVFGYQEFRANQQEVIQAIIDGKDVFTSMPTGGGKSLCYQIPGLMFPGLTVVVSPLIALMKDQVDEALTKGIPAAYLNSTLSGPEISQIYHRLYNQEIKLLYISPERLAIEGYLEKLGEFKVCFFAVDEAHCLSEWGHDFRPDYLILSKLRKAFPSVPIAAFTATATLQVQKDIIRILRLHKPVTIRASFYRKELFYSVQDKVDLNHQLFGFLKKHPEDSGIIYRFSRKDVDSTALFLQNKGIKALPYHAGLTKEQRTNHQELFNQDEVQVVVATIAFGMGINKSNIRFVIHGDLPKSMEGYYQETGRAGRDGLDSVCILFYSPGDISKQQFFINQIDDPKERAKSNKTLYQLVDFASGTRCRHEQILAYFDEPFQAPCGNCDICLEKKQKITLVKKNQKSLDSGSGANHRTKFQDQGNSLKAGSVSGSVTGSIAGTDSGSTGGAIDDSIDSRVGGSVTGTIDETIEEKIDASIDAQKILSAIVRTNQGFGIQHIIDIVWGAKTEKIRNFGHQNLKTYGAGKDKSKIWWKSVIQELLKAEAIFQDLERFGVLRLTDFGKEILYGKKPFLIKADLQKKRIGNPETWRKSASGTLPDSPHWELSQNDTRLLQILKETRKELAQQFHVPPYIIFSDKTLMDIALLKPETEEDFLLVSGVGAKKLELYGEAFLGVIREHSDSK